MVYWGKVHDDMFDTCIQTFRKHSNALLQVYSDHNNIPTVSDTVIREVSKDRVEGRRALCKIECLKELVDQLQDGDRLLVSDIDVYFLSDPFTAFKFEFDVGVTARSHHYIQPINAGIFYMTINANTRKWIDFHLEQSTEPTWDTMVNLRRRYGRKYTPDWTVGQDFLAACYLDPKYIKERFSITVRDVGWQYNFCPSVDVFGFTECMNQLKHAYENNSVTVLHLKSALKMCIYEGWMEAVNKNPKGNWNWENS